jgi:hypothetical protein
MEASIAARKTLMNTRPLASNSKIIDVLCRDSGG